MTDHANDRKPAAGPTPRTIVQHLAMLSTLGSYKARYNQLLDQIDAAVLLVEPDSGIIFEASPNSGPLTGIPPSQLRGMPLAALLGQPAVPRLIAELVRLAPQETRTVRRITLATGRRATVDARFSILNEDGSPRRLHVVLADVTELRLLDSALAQRGELLISLAGLAGQAQAHDENVLPNALATALAILHVPAGALYLNAGGMLHRVTAESDPGSAMAFPDVLTSENAATRTGIDLLPLPADRGMLLLYSPAGTLRAMDPDFDAVRTAVAACLVAVVSAWQARTHERQAQEAYRHVLHLQSTLLERVASGVILLDRQGRILIANEPAAHLLGYSADEIVGMSYNAVLITRRPIDECLQPALAGRAEDPAKLMLINRDGAEIPVRLSATPLGDAQDAGVLVVIEDLSAHKEQDEQARDVDRLTFLAEVSPVLAHEIRNPLASIQAGVQYVATKVEGDAELNEMMAMVTDEIRRLNLLLADFLAAARPVELRLMPCMLSDLLEGLAAKRAADLQRRGIQVHRKYAPDTPPALADRTRLEQVFVNLIDNAIQAMAENGVLTLECGVANGSAGGGTPRVWAKVSDTGPGIAPEVMERIFQPFYTTKKAQGGTGLGLPISRRIVNAHNGMLDVESHPGAGTRFTVTLPIYAQ